MNYSNIEKIITYGTQYRRQELAAFLEEDTDAYGLADDISIIMITMKNVMPPEVWRATFENLLKYTSDNQFELLVEREYDEENSDGTPTGE